MSSLEAFLNHPIETLEKALQIRKQIDQLYEVLKELFGPTPVSLAGVQTTAPKRRGRPRKLALEDGIESRDGLIADGRKKKRKMSADAREKIAAAQRARWAKSKGEKPEVTTEANPNKKQRRKMSAEGRARIIAAQKKRWAKAKAAKK